MKMVSRMALGLALSLGATTLIAPPLVAAKKEKAPEGPKYDLSKPVRAAAAAAQEALGKGDLVTAKAKAEEAVAASTTPDDRFVANSVLYEAVKASPDVAAKNRAVEGMLASGKATPEMQAQMQLLVGNNAFQAKDYAKAETALAASIAGGTTVLDAYAMLAETKAALNKPVEAIGIIEQAAVKERAAGRKIPPSYYQRAISIGYKAKLAQPLEKLSQEWVADYPTTTNWRDALLLYRDLNKLDADVEVDILRMLRTAGALKGERDYMEIVQATYLRFPGEAKAVLEEGQKNGQLNLSAGSAKELYDLVKGKIASDKASLGKTAANGRVALAVGDAYKGYGQYADAIEMYRMALTKGGADANVINTHLGEALARSGDKAGAKQAFAAVTGSRAVLARFWTIWLDAPAAPAA